MQTTLTILGSGTCNVVPGQAAASVLIHHAGVRLVYDFGRGVASRLAEIGLTQDDIQHIFISHTHPDHLSDLIPYLQAANWSQIDKRQAPLHIYGSPQTIQFLRKLFDLFGTNETQKNFPLTLHTVTRELVINGWRMQLADLQHAHGLEWDDYAIAGDSALNKELIQLLQGKRLAVFDAGHITDDEIVQLAARTQAQTLICSHQYRKLHATTLHQQAQAQGYTGTLVVAKDLQKFVL